MPFRHEEPLKTGQCKTEGVEMERPEWGNPVLASGLVLVDQWLTGNMR